MSSDRDGRRAEPGAQERFYSLLCGGATLRDAASGAGVSLATAYRWKREAPAVEVPEERDDRDDWRPVSLILAEQLARMGLQCAQP